MSRQLLTHRFSFVRNLHVSQLSWIIHRTTFWRRRGEWTNFAAYMVVWQCYCISLFSDVLERAPFTAISLPAFNSFLLWSGMMSTSDSIIAMLTNRCLFWNHDLLVPHINRGKELYRWIEWKLCWRGTKRSTKTVFITIPKKCLSERRIWSWKWAFLSI